MDTTRNVVTALSNVMQEIGGIEKLTAEERRRRGMGGGDTGVGYAYRGIDQIAAAAQPLFGKHGVIIVPSVTEQHVEQIQINNRPWSDTSITVAWSIYGPGGPNDVITAVTTGIGRDNSDKGVNKAMTGAFKNLLLRLLCIGDPADDTDGHTHEADAAQQSAPQNKAAADLYEQLVKLGKDKNPAAAALKDWATTQDKPLTYKAFDTDRQWLDAVVEYLDNLL